MSLLSLGAVILVFASLAVCAYLYIFREYEVFKLDKRDDVKLLRNTLREEIRVVDADSKQTIFRYSDGEGMVLENIEKLPNGEWKIMMRDLSRTH